jgi:hypothetical protein
MAGIPCASGAVLIFFGALFPRNFKLQPVSPGMLHRVGPDKPGNVIPTDILLLVVDGQLQRRKLSQNILMSDELRRVPRYVCRAEQSLAQDFVAQSKAFRVKRRREELALSLEYC